MHIRQIRVKAACPTRGGKYDRLRDGQPSKRGVSENVYFTVYFLTMLGLSMVDWLFLPPTLTLLQKGVGAINSRRLETADHRAHKNTSCLRRLASFGLQCF